MKQKKPCSKKKEQIKTPSKLKENILGILSLIALAVVAIGVSILLNLAAWGVMNLTHVNTTHTVPTTIKQMGCTDNGGNTKICSSLVAYETTSYKPFTESFMQWVSTISMVLIMVIFIIVALGIY